MQVFFPFLSNINPLFGRPSSTLHTVDANIEKLICNIQYILMIFLNKKYHDKNYFFRQLFFYYYLRIIVI